MQPVSAAQLVGPGLNMSGLRVRYPSENGNNVVYVRIGKTQCPPRAMLHRERRMSRFWWALKMRQAVNITRRYSPRRR